MAQRKKGTSLAINSTFFSGFVVAFIFGVFLLVLSIQLKVVQLSVPESDVFAGKAGLPGSNKNPDWYTTCTGADPSNPDQMPPTTSIESPADNAQVTRKQIVNIKTNASDNVLLNRNELHVNGVFKGVVYSSTSPYYQGWEVPPNATSGTIYTIISKTCDQAGNYATSTIKLIVP